MSQLQGEKSNRDRRYGTDTDAQEIRTVCLFLLFSFLGVPAVYCIRRGFPVTSIGLLLNLMDDRYKTSCFLFSFLYLLYLFPEENLNLSAAIPIFPLPLSCFLPLAVIMRDMGDLARDSKTPKLASSRVGTTRNPFRVCKSPTHD